MSPRRPKPQGTRRTASARVTNSADMWRPVPPLPKPEAITPAADPTLLVRSLGDPPLPRNSVVAGRYLATVVERAAAMAAALAASVDLLAGRDRD